MKNFNRRRFLTAGIVTAAGAAGLYGAERLANRYGLIPPDAAQRAASRSMPALSIDAIRSPASPERSPVGAIRAAAPAVRIERA